MTVAVDPLDPQYAAIANGLLSRRQQLIANDKFNRAQAQTAYDYAVANLRRAEPLDHKRLGYSLEARGVAASGEHRVKDTAIKTDYAQRAADDDTNRLKAIGLSGQQLQSGLSDWSAQWEQQKVASDQRKLERQHTLEGNAQTLAAAQLRPGINFADPYFHGGQPVLRPGIDFGALHRGLAAPHLRPGIDFAALRRGL